MDDKTLLVTWNIENTVSEDRMKHWIDLVTKEAETEKFNVGQFLEDLFDDTKID